MEELDFFGSIRTMDFDEAISQGLVTIMGQETDELFLQSVLSQALESVEASANNFKMVYTPFHGAGYKLVPDAIHRIGIKHIFCVPEQMKIDGSFPTVKSPNPEEPDGFELAISLAKKQNAGLIIGTDPDCDRVGVMAPNNRGEFVLLSGNQTGILLLDYIIGAKKRAGTMPENPATLKTIVTSEMARRVAEENGVASYDTFTGFKFMAEKKNQLEESGQGNVIFSFEESYGYMLGDFVRDKDGVTASMLIAEMAAWYFAQGMTLHDAMQKLYEKYGQYGEETLNIMLPGLEGMARMRELMGNLRENPPSTIAGEAVVLRKDFLSGYELDPTTGQKTPIELSGSNVLRFDMADGTVILVRPSGTEPKVKVYIMARGKTRAECDLKIQKYIEWVNRRLA
jgi:phosphoglucomutase